MREKKSLIETVRGLSSWAYRMSEEGPHSTRIDFFDVTSQANRFLENLEGSLDSLAEHEGITHNRACLELRRILFYGHETFHYDDEPDTRKILRLCLHLGIRAPVGWHAHFLLVSKRYRSIHRPNRRLKCPDYIREIREKNA